MNLTSEQESEADPRAGEHRGDCGHGSLGVMAVTRAGTVSSLLKNHSLSFPPRQGSPNFPFKEEQSCDTILDSGMLVVQLPGVGSQTHP